MIIVNLGHKPGASQVYPVFRGIELGDPNWFQDPSAGSLPAHIYIYICVLCHTRGHTNFCSGDSTRPGLSQASQVCPVVLEKLGGKIMTATANERERRAAEKRERKAEKIAARRDRKTGASQ